MQLCVALDLPSRKENLALARNLKDFDIWLKVGLRSYVRDGAEFIKELKTINSSYKIFLDLKLYDIPNTMADTAEVIANLGVDMFNIHASAGEVAMKTVMQRISPYKNRPLVLAVTALTSFDEEEFSKIYSSDIETTATKFAKLSFQNNLDGVVSSVHESHAIKNATSNEFITLTPGIRPFGVAGDDQKRIADIKTAKNELSDFIVVGRPIYKSENPAETTKIILQQMSEV